MLRYVWDELGKGFNSAMAEDCPKRNTLLFLLTLSLCNAIPRHSSLTFQENWMSHSKNNPHCSKEPFMLCWLDNLKLAVLSTLFPYRWAKSVTFSNAFIMLAGIWLGPIAGALVGGISDLLGCLISGYAPSIPYMIAPITTGVLAGICAPLFRKNKNVFIRNWKRKMDWCD